MQLAVTHPHDSSAAMQVAEQVPEHAEGDAPIFRLINAIPGETIPQVKSTCASYRPNSTA